MFKERKSLMFSLALAGVFCMVFIVGCGSHNVSTIKTYEIVTNYDRMSSDYEPRLSLVYVNPEAKLAEYSTLIIKRVDVSKVWVRDKEQAELFRPFIEEQIRDAIVREKIFKRVVVDPRYIELAPPEEKILVMEAVITRLKAGNGTARYFFLLGATDFQLEGRLVDARTQKTVVEFAERRRELGETPWDPKLKTFDNDDVLKRTIRMVARNFSVFLRDIAQPAAGSADVAEKVNRTAVKDERS